jgi:hypothetical protein
MDIPRHWRRQEQRFRLQGNRCEKCQTVTFPPKPVCPKCGGRDFTPCFLSGKGHVYSHATVYQTSDAFADYVPYVVAIVETEEGVRLVAQLTDVDPEEVFIGMPVEMVIRKISEEGDRGMITYGYKFRPLLLSQ